MSRSAIAASLLLHASLLAMVGRWAATHHTNAGPGDPGVGVVFLADDSGGTLVIETPRAEPPVPEPEAPPVEPAFTAPAPTIAPPEPPVAVVTTAAPSPVSTLPALPRGRPAGKAPAGKVAALSKTARSGGHGGTVAGSGGEGGGSGYVPPQFRLRYKPLYPEEARAQRLAGTVILLVSIDSAGAVSSASVRQSCGHSILDRAALTAVRSWRFTPARQDGAAIAAQVEVPVRFRFEERAARA